MSLFSTIRWRWLGAAALFAAVGGLLAVPTANAQATYEAAKKEGKVVFYSGQPIELLQNLKDDFQSTYPGIDVDFFRGDTRQYAQRFETESQTGRHNVDVMLSTSVTTPKWVAKDLLAPYVSPMQANYPAELRDANGYNNPYAVNMTSFAWNTDLVKPGEEPKTWDDLLDPKWKGKIAIQDPLGRGGAFTWTVTMRRELGEAKWLDYMKKLAAQEPKYGRYMQVREMVMSGEVAIHVAAYPDFTEPVKVKGAPVDWGVPEWLVFVGLTVSLSANAPHPEAGKLFIDYMMSDSAQTILGESGRIPAKPGLRGGAYAKLKNAKIVTSGIPSQVVSDEYFKENLRMIFGKKQ
jgi:iron(III) transport system substrate-binding protein